jgi:hypothetical protein
VLEAAEMTLAIGQKIGKWEVLSQVPGKRDTFLCRCECGVTRAVRGWNIEWGKSRSCGHEIAKRHESVMSEVFQKRAMTREIAQTV